MGKLTGLVAATGLLGPGVQDAAVLDRIRADEDRMVLIPPDALILAEDVSKGAIERQRAELRGTAPLTAVERARGVVAVVLLTAIALYGVYSRAEDLAESVRAGHVSSVILDVVVGLALLTFVGVLWYLHVRHTRAHVAGTSQALGATGGTSQRDLILDWLDHYWSWPCPPHLFADAYADMQGYRQGFPFLLVSELVYSDSDLRTAHMNRTCVFLAGSGGERARLDVPDLFPWDITARAVITPAGLFAWWPLAILHGDSPPERYGHAVDKLAEIARRHGVVPPAASSPLPHLVQPGEGG